MQDTPVLHPFMEGTIRGFNTFMRSRFILQILYRNATMYLRYLRIIDRESDKLELKLAPLHAEPRDRDAHGAEQDFGVFHHNSLENRTKS